ncbi:hypothetical protein HanPI659440_Chr12g0464971 [Helianthus annuus]|nr:hypothetical protein HanIR_Chr12g0590271 [Helianthus annuus]KAJ0725971.1 hypothetical protein HanPI659440_Chr12g0464971 [Helianthus annuus]
MKRTPKIDLTWDETNPITQSILKDKLILTRYVKGFNTFFVKLYYFRIVIYSFYGSSVCYDIIHVYDGIQVSDKKNTEEG